MKRGVYVGFTWGKRLPIAVYPFVYDHSCRRKCQFGQRIAAKPRGVRSIVASFKCAADDLRAKSDDHISFAAIIETAEHFKEFEIIDLQICFFEDFAARGITRIFIDIHKSRRAHPQAFCRAKAALHQQHLIVVGDKCQYRYCWREKNDVSTFGTHRTDFAVAFMLFCCCAADGTEIRYVIHITDLSLNDDHHAVSLPS